MRDRLQFPVDTVISDEFPADRGPRLSGMRPVLGTPDCAIDDQFLDGRGS